MQRNSLSALSLDLLSSCCLLGSTLNEYGILILHVSINESSDLYTGLLIFVSPNHTESGVELMLVLIVQVVVTWRVINFQLWIHIKNSASNAF